MQLATQVILLYLSIALSVARSQIAAAALSNDVISAENVIAIKNENWIEKSMPIEYSIEEENEEVEEEEEDEEEEMGNDDMSLRKRRIIAGVDDDRKDIRKTCYVHVKPTPYLPNLSSPLECARTCKSREQPKICYYRFFVEYYSVVSSACKPNHGCRSNETNAFCNNCQCVYADGIERPILTVNRMIPGPSIDVCEGDRIVVDVVNAMEGDELTIHWHGMFQKDSQYYDGAAFITQCPIPEQTTFRYQFNADNAGTHFWHAHTGLQKLDGVFGRLTVRQSSRNDVNSNLYDFDLSRHGIIINDWMHELAVSRLPGGLSTRIFQDPVNMLINGKGHYKNPNNVTYGERQVFHVKRNYRYRFRLVNTFCTVCSSILTVENHNLTLIALDGIAIKPTVVNSIISVSGERYDFIINANRPTGSYWIQLRAISSCTDRNLQQLAILQYDGASDTPKTPEPTFTRPLRTGIILNPLDKQYNSLRTDAIYINDLHCATPVDRDILMEEPDAKIYLPFRFHQYDERNLFKPNRFKKFVVAADFRHSTSLMDDISLVLPSSPLLTQSQDIPSNMICNNTYKSMDCGDKCDCTHVIELPYKGIVELIIIDQTNVSDLYHPFHLHGYAFNVMAMGVLDNGKEITIEEVKRLDQQGLLSRNIISPPFKDTIAVPNNGYAIIRFRADNPGYWLLHCHFIYHLAVGMGVIFHVGEPSDLPPVPRDFPKCGNYLPPIQRN